MDYFNIGDLINEEDYNAIVYLLRKFKRLTSDLKLGNNTINSDYGTYTIIGGLTNIDGNYIIESPAIITSNDVLLNCFYTFNFTVIDVNTSGVVNRRVVSVTGYTGNDGVLSVTLPVDLIESDEVILPNFKVDIVFDEHEYYTPTSALNISLSVDETYIKAGETNNIYATVTDASGTPKSGVLLGFDVNGTVTSVTTNSDGVASITYTGTGTLGKAVVTVSQVSTVFYDGGVEAEYTGNSITLGPFDRECWLESNGNVVIDWGDETRTTVNNPLQSLTHDYNDNQSNHTITFCGDITSLGEACFYRCTGLTSVIIPNSVTSLGDYCFTNCTGLTSVIIPNSVITIGNGCFHRCTGLTSVIIPNSVTTIDDWCFTNCTSLIDYQLYWMGNNIITYNSYKMPNNANTIFTIPTGETSNYVAKGYPSNKLQERGGSLTPTTLSLASSGDINVGESVTLTGTLLDDDNNGVSGASVEIYKDSVLLDTVTTDSNGEYSKTVTGLTAGSYSFKSVYDGDSIYDASESSVVSVTVHDFSLSLTGTSIIQTGDTTTVTATLTDNGVAVEGETLDYEIKHGSTTIATGTTSATDSNGQATISYTGTGVGDVDIIVSKTSMSLQETYIIEDCYRYDLATSDKTSSYGSPITYRGSNSGTWNYNSSNGYYGTITDQNEVMIPFTELTGKDDFTIEFDAKLNYSTSIRGIAGICAYEDNNNYSRISCHAQKIAQRVSVNGSATESESDTLTTVNQGDVLHYKFTVHNNQIIEEVTKGTTSVGTRTISYTPTNNTKYGFSLVWQNSWVSNTFLKNIKVKSL